MNKWYDEDPDKKASEEYEQKAKDAASGCPKVLLKVDGTIFGMIYGHFVELILHPTTQGLPMEFMLPIPPTFVEVVNEQEEVLWGDTKYNKALVFRRDQPKDGLVSYSVVTEGPTSAG